MLRLHPNARLLDAALLLAAVLVARSFVGLLVIYAAIGTALVLSGCLAQHLRFMVLVTLPLLAALLLLWGLALHGHTPPSQSTGLGYATFCWLRIVTGGAVLQWLFVPLIEQPTHLRCFLRSNGFGGSIGILIIASVTFLPEVHRRITRIVDARRAQGHSTRGLGGLYDLPRLLMPLVSSLLDAALQRAELWSHRGVLDRHANQVLTHDHSVVLSVITLGLSFTLVLLTLWL